MSKLIARAQRILLAPKSEWPVIAAEPDSIGGIYRGYVAILAAIGPVAVFLKSTLIGYGVPFIGTWRVPMMDGILALLIGYALALGATWVFALIIDALAPQFGAQKNRLMAFKAAAYSMTAAWIAGVGQLLPVVGLLVGLAGAAYSVYLLYLGLPATMKCPADKSVAYTAVSVVCAIVLFWLAAAIAGTIAGRGAWMGAPGWLGAPSATRDRAFDEDSALGRLEQWSREMEAAGKRVEKSAQAQGGIPEGAAVGQFMGALAGGGKAVEALGSDQLKALVPEALGGLPRTDLSVERSGALGFQVAEARASYADGQGRSLRFELTDAGGARGFLALANWANVEQQREWAGGFERDYRQNGRMIHERWDAASSRAEYGVVVGNRFILEVEGGAGSIDELKAAVAAGIDLAVLEAIATTAKPADGKSPK